MRTFHLIPMLGALALAAGAVVVANACVAPSFRCAKHNCAGCCDKGVCLAPAKQSNAVCGSEGNACKPCSDLKLCHTSGQYAGRCMTNLNALDAGSCGREGEECCAQDPACDLGLSCQLGVCLPEPPPGGTDAGPCGALGQTCCLPPTTCDLSLVCRLNVCESGAPTAKPTGSPCDGGGECQGQQCFLEQLPGTTFCQEGPNPCWLQGYCTQDCSSPQTPCAAGSSCSRQGQCFQNCTFDGAAGSCRTGYVCDRRWVINNQNQAICFKACQEDGGCAGLGGGGLQDPMCREGFCCGKTGFRCCAGPSPCPITATSCGTDGYCL